MTDETIKPILIRIPQSTYDKLKAYQYIEAQRTPYRVTMQSLILQAIELMLNDTGVTPAQATEDVETIIREHLARSTRYLGEPSTYAQAAERVNFFVTTFTKDRQLCPPGSPLRAEVEDHLARWDAMRG